jgi:dihydroorotate dehydrogenase
MLSMFIEDTKIRRYRKNYISNKYNLKNNIHQNYIKEIKKLTKENIKLVIITTKNYIFII